MTRPRLLDLFSGAGGSARGYQLAGFHVTGIDINPQPRYAGDEFVQADAMTYPLDGFDAVHASPPCQAYSTQTANPSRHPRLIAAVRARLLDTGVLFVIENVEAARPELVSPVRLCGSSFGLNLRRHRLFETSGFHIAAAPPCAHHWQTPRFRSLDITMVRSGRLASVVGVHGHLNYAGEFELRCKAMGIDWMTNAELSQAIPPAYCTFIGEQLMAHLSVVA